MYLLSDHYPMWKYTPQGMDKEMGMTNSHVSLSIMAIKYPATIFIYLSKFPSGSKLKQVLYIVFWVLLYAINEFIDLSANLIQYYNGWNLWWSILFNAVIFIILRIHFSKPLLAWVYSFVFIVILWNIFEVPLQYLGEYIWLIHIIKDRRSSNYLLYSILFI